MIASLTLLIFASISFLLLPTLTIQQGHLLMQIKYAFAYSLGGRCMICQDFYKLWKSLAFRCRRFYVQKEWLFLEKQVLLNFSRVFQGKGMSTTPLWLVQNVRLPDREGLWQIAIENGRFGAITPMDETHSESYEVLNARGGLAIPPFIEPHIHLDTTQTAGEPHWNQSGTLFEGIERWAERKALLSHEDVKARAWKTLKWQIANGIQFVRTHVDVSDPTLTALKAMLEVKQEVAPWVTLQIVAFPQEGILSYPNGAALLEEALTLGADVVGAIPHFEFTREYGVQSLHIAFDLAKKYDRPLDIHCDEIDDEQSRFVETVATLAYEAGIGARVTASHTTAMHSYNGAYTSRLFRLLKMSGINFVANPLVNIHLQGRFDDYPKRRGITRVKELQAAGINVCFGHDDVFDPWYPLGTGNMLQVLHMGLHVCQMMGYPQIDSGLNLITHNSARTFGLSDYGIETGNPANLVILPAESGFEAVRCQVTVRWSIRQGRIIATTQLAQTWIQMDSGGEEISFARNSPSA
jgi:cytosine deaminase